jgi:hypothetical protein
MCLAYAEGLKGDVERGYMGWYRVIEAILDGVNGVGVGEAASVILDLYYCCKSGLCLTYF